MTLRTIKLLHPPEFHHSNCNPAATSKPIKLTTPIVKIVRGLAHALSCLHHDCSPPIVHRDVSLNNILLETELET